MVHTQEEGALVADPQALYLGETSTRRSASGSGVSRLGALRRRAPLFDLDTRSSLAVPEPPAAALRAGDASHRNVAMVRVYTRRADAFADDAGGVL